MSDGDIQHASGGWRLPMTVYAAICAAAIVVFLLALRIGTAVEEDVGLPSPTPRQHAPVALQPDDVGVKTPPGGNIASFFSTDSYPAEALRRNEQGRTVARLTVSATGTVSACAVDTSSGSASLDGATCRIALTRVRFQPALDAAGHPVPSHFRLPVRWVLPDDPAPAAAPTHRPWRDLPIVPALIAFTEAFIVSRAITKGELKASRSGEVVSRETAPAKYWAIVGFHGLIGVALLVFVIGKLVG